MKKSFGIKGLVATALALAAASCTPAHAASVQEECAALAPVFVDINAAHAEGYAEYTLVRHILDQDLLTQEGHEFVLALVRLRYGPLDDEKISDRDFAVASYEICVNTFTPTY